MINAYKKQQVVERAEKIYMVIAEDDKRLAEDFLSICNRNKSWIERVLGIGCFMRRLPQLRIHKMRVKD